MRSTRRNLHGFRTLGRRRRRCRKLAHAVSNIVDHREPECNFVYDENMSPWDKISHRHQAVRCREFTASPSQSATDAWDASYGRFPVCMAKTQMSFSTNPTHKRSAFRPCGGNQRCEFGERRRFYCRGCRRHDDHAGLPRVLLQKVSISTITAKSPACFKPRVQVA